jgi:hypothetical protein
MIGQPDIIPLRAVKKRAPDLEHVNSGRPLVERHRACEKGSPRHQSDQAGSADKMLLRVAGSAGRTLVLCIPR